MRSRSAHPADAGQRSAPARPGCVRGSPAARLRAAGGGRCRPVTHGLALRPAAQGELAPAPRPAPVPQAPPRAFQAANGLLGQVRIGRSSRSLLLSSAGISGWLRKVNRCERSLPYRFLKRWPSRWVGASATTASSAHSRRRRYSRRVLGARLRCRRASTTARSSNALMRGGEHGVAGFHGVGAVA